MCTREFFRGHHVGAIFFDIEKAYDTTWQHGLLLKLHSLGIRGNMGEFSHPPHLPRADWKFIVAPF